MFRQVYMGSRHVTFQTCIEKDGNSELGTTIRDRGAGGLRGRSAGAQTSERPP